MVYGYCTKVIRSIKFSRTPRLCLTTELALSHAETNRLGPMHQMEHIPKSRSFLKVLDRVQGLGGFRVLGLGFRV